MGRVDMRTLDGGNEATGWTTNPPIRAQCCRTHSRLLSEIGHFERVANHPVPPINHTGPLDGGNDWEGGVEEGAAQKSDGRGVLIITCERNTVVVFVFLVSDVFSNALLKSMNERFNIKRRFVEIL